MPTKPHVTHKYNLEVDRYPNDLTTFRLWKDRVSLQPRIHTKRQWLIVVGIGKNTRRYERTVKFYPPNKYTQARTTMVSFGFGKIEVIRYV